MFPFFCPYGCLLTCQCVDIEFAEPEDVAEVTRENCFNSSDIGFEYLFSTTSLQASEASRALGHGVLSAVPVVLVGLFGFLML